MRPSLKSKRGQAGIVSAIIILIALFTFISIIYTSYDLTSQYEEVRQKVSQLEIERLEENLIIEKIGLGLGVIHINVTNTGSVPILIKYAIVVYKEKGELRLVTDELNVYLNVGERIINVKIDVPPPPIDLKYIILVTSRGRSFIKVIEAT